MEAASQFVHILRTLIGLDDVAIDVATDEIGVTLETKAFAIPRDKWISYNEQIGKCCMVQWRCTRQTRKNGNRR